MVVCIVKVLRRMVFMIAIIFGNWTSSLGMIVSSSSMFSTMTCKLSSSLSTPSMASKIDLSDQQIGMSKQCGSQ